MTWFIKAIVWLLFGFIFISLGSALYYLTSEKHNSDKMIKALTWRLGLSFILFALLFVAYGLGWITPHSIG